MDIVMVDFTEQLRNDRRAYVRLRERAALIAATYPTDIGKAAADQCRVLDGAIANVDAALPGTSRIGHKRT
ncbi:hypothetical protein [Bradyrhizobium quebecense]|uniref:Uncharacterized protein n=2 Tax=Bradyrhizobium quebecense TaxID=2748629 RepID=A0ACD3VA61_9BRAD|nr:hypothetical protein [Bradyrhizobium quebecense]UGY03265.1 hypothetical protein J4P68_0000335 [Bradyrhizobium quebecense]